MDALPLLLPPPASTGETKRPAAMWCRPAETLSGIAELYGVASQQAGVRSTAISAPTRWRPAPGLGPAFTQLRRRNLLQPDPPLQATQAKPATPEHSPATAPPATAAPPPSNHSPPEHSRRWRPASGGTMALSRWISPLAALGEQPGSRPRFNNPGQQLFLAVNCSQTRSTPRRGRRLEDWARTPRPTLKNG